MIRTYFILFFFALAIFSCTQTLESKKHIPNPFAVSLNDSALNLYLHDGGSRDSIVTMKAIALLDQATAIDPDYFLAWYNKRIFLNSSKQYYKSLQTEKELIRLRPNEPEFYGAAGISCDKIGDSINAQVYYQSSLMHSEAILDTMSINNLSYDMRLYEKGVTLILMGRNEEGNDILKNIYKKEENDPIRKMFERFLGKSREEILELILENPEG